MLSAKELFKYRQALDKTIPQRGGEKDYMPDGSWLQDKKLENFNVERQMVLSEPRVQREGDLVKGEWKPDRKLVEFQREMKNFWEHMGFMDRLRKWLYPEEALFLMETSVLEVWYNGLPISISEGYMMFLDETLTLEYYQVFAHLRRIGFVVLRHQGRKHITKYEQQIGLDKIRLSRKERKALWRKNQKDTKVEDSTNTAVDSPSQRYESETVSEDINVDNDTRNVDVDKDDSSKVMEDSTKQTSDCDKDSNYKHDFGNEMREYENDQLVDIDNAQIEPGESANIEAGIKNEISIDGSLSLSHKQESVSSNIVEEDKFLTTSGQKSDIKHIDETSGETSDENKTKTCTWNFDEIKFPDFGVEEPVIKITQPNKDQTPDNFETSNLIYEFDRVTLINKKKEKRKNRKEEAENEKLKFSCSMMTEEFTQSIKSCRNWKEYKEEKARRRQLWRRRKEFPHLFDDVEPLVKPELAKSTAAVLEQLQIIKGEPKDHQNVQDKPSVLPHFDVYKPDTKFRKSSPGVPDHRVVVAKCSDPMPELSTIQSITSYLQDEVPLKWAVVETGNIAFYDVSQFFLPLDIPFG